MPRLSGVFALSLDKMDKSVEFHYKNIGKNLGRRIKRVISLSNVFSSVNRNKIEMPHIKFTPVTHLYFDFDTIPSTVIKERFRL